MKKAIIKLVLIALVIMGTLGAEVGSCSTAPNSGGGCTTTVNKGG